MEIKLVEAFALIMRTGSITRAESESGTPKSTLSRLLRNLEIELGVQPLERSSRRLVPTDAGRVLHAHCESLLADLRGRRDAARLEIQEMRSATKGRIRILSDNHFTTTLVCHAARAYLAKYPHIVCELDAAGREDSPRMEDVDGYVCAGAPDLPDVVAELVGRLSYGQFASPEYLRKRGGLATPIVVSEPMLPQWGRH
jgi:DNA-binding transcriptional LysR family regulator